MKKRISILLVAFMVLSCVTGFLTVCAANENKYMAKLVPHGGIVWSSIAGNALEAGSTYTFVCKYYAKTSSTAAGEYTSVWFNSNTPQQVGEGEYDGKNAGEIKNSVQTLEVKWVAPENSTWFAIDFSNNSTSTDFYFWDMAVYKGNETKNLMTNPGFAKNGGTWIGWMMSNYQNGTEYIDTTAESTAAAAQSGNLILAYDKELEPYYMAKMKGTADKWHTAYQDLTVVPNKTYEFSFDYYVSGGTGSDLATTAQLRNNFNNKSEQLAGGTSGRTTLELTVTGTEKWLRVAYICQPNSECYVWNVSFKEKGTSEELLTNATWEQGNGSWNGWKIDSEANFQIIPYSDRLWNTMDLADWSMKPILAETLDVNYIVKLKVTPVTGTTPTMTFVLQDKDEAIKITNAQGKLLEDGSYSFGMEVLPQHMAHRMIATLSVCGENGVVTQTKSWTVKEYCAAVLEDSDISAQTKALVADMLRYGAKVQAMYGLTDSITSGLESVMENYGSSAALSDISDYVEAPISEGQSEASYKWRGASLVLDGRIVIRLKFTTEANDISNLKIKINNTEYTPYIYEEGVYCVDIPVAATCHDTKYQATFYVDGVSQGATLSYSVNTYLYRKKDVVPQQELLTSIYRYGESAKTYSIADIPIVSGRDNELKDEWNLK